MNSNSIGKALVFTCFGESHGPCIGAVIDGCPAGLPLEEEDIEKELVKRQPGLAAVNTRRRELDIPEILSGVYAGHTTGAPLCVVIRNLDIESTPYEKIRQKPRPGHADYPASARYGEYNDHRGGGRFSGRITAAYVMVGAIAKKLLALIELEALAHTVQIGKTRISKQVSCEEIRENVYRNSVRCAIPETATLMEEEILTTAKQGDSLGGIVEGIALNVPVGLGDPIFGSLDSEIARIMFSIPGVKGVEFGIGFNAASMKGSENNDEYAFKDGRIIALSNNAGGILGGISNGMPIMVRVAFKPTPSISKYQKTVDIDLMRETRIRMTGRHDPCIVPRAVPVVEACLAFVLADHALRLGKIPQIIKKED